MAYTPYYSQGVKFIKIARIDDQGNDNTLSLQELDTVRIKFSDVGVVDYPITSIAKYDDYFLFGVATTNKTSSTDNEILNYRASGSKKYIVGNGVDDTIITNYTEAYDNLGYFNPTTGIYTLGNLPNIPIRFTFSASITGSTSGNVSVFINSSIQGVVGSTSVSLGGSPYKQIITGSYNGVAQANEQFYLTITNNSVGNTEFTGSFFVTQSTAPSAGISDLVVLEPFVDADFANSDYDVLAGNAVQPRVNPFYMDVDYSTNALQAVNIVQILSGSATRATVQASNYTYASQVNGRYAGSKVDSANINTYTPPTEFTGSTPGSPASSSFTLNTLLSDYGNGIQINFGNTDSYSFIPSDLLPDTPPVYYFTESLNIPDTLKSASLKINSVLSGSNALAFNLLKTTYTATKLILTSSLDGAIFNSITVYTGSDSNGYKFMTALEGGTDPTNNNSVYGYSGYWPGDNSYGKTPTINLYDSCIYEFTNATKGYPVLENGGTINLGNIYLVGDTVDSVSTIDYVDPSYQSTIQRNLIEGSTIYQQQYVNANELPITLDIALNGAGVNQSSYYIPSTYTASYVQSMVTNYIVPGIIWFYGSGSLGTPTFGTPFVEFQDSGNIGINPVQLNIPITSISGGFEQTGSLVANTTMALTISSSINNGDRWFMSFYNSLPSRANGIPLEQYGSPIEINYIQSVGYPTSEYRKFNFILKTDSVSLTEQLQSNSVLGLGSIGGKNSSALTGSGYGVLIWKANTSPNLITNVGSNSDLYNNVTAGYILLDPTKDIIKNNVSYITKKYGKNNTVITT